MGLFGFLGDVTSAAVKVVASPIAIASDVISVATGDDANATNNLIRSIGDDLEDAGDEIF